MQFEGFASCSSLIKLGKVGTHCFFCPSVDCVWNASIMFSAGIMLPVAGRPNYDCEDLRFI